MSKDGLLPPVFSDVHPKFRTPYNCNIVLFFFFSIFAGFIPESLAGDLTSIGTLFAFVLVAIGGAVLRYKDPSRPRGFRCPGGSVLPILSVIFCVLLMAGLPVLTWIRFFGWLAIGLLIYYFYSRHRSEFSSTKRLNS